MSLFDRYTLTKKKLLPKNEQQQQQTKKRYVCAYELHGIFSLIFSITVVHAQHDQWRIFVFMIHNEYWNRWWLLLLLLLLLQGLLLDWHVLSVFIRIIIE